MKYSPVLASMMFAPLILVACTGATPAQNPDPNHTHADFAVWIDNVKLDFSGEEFMEAELTHEEEEALKREAGEVEDLSMKNLKKYLHLHDGNGRVMHRHKPGLTVANFFSSIRVGFRDKCFTSGVPMQDGELCSENSFRLFVNGKEQPFDDLSYVFADGDNILITTAHEEAEVMRELGLMTNDACLYSKTCPERGDPPEEGCIADPEVPCVQ